MTAATIAAIPMISVSVTAPASDSAYMGARAHSEPVGRFSDAADDRRAVSFGTVAAARDGDSDAMGRLCTLVHPRLVAFYRYSGLPAEAAQDVAGDVIEDIVTRLSTLRNPEAFDAWMWSIGRNRLRGWIRVTRRPARFEPVAPTPPGPEERAIDADDHSRIIQALSMLSKRNRELLWLREVEGLSYEEIGGRLGAATGTIRVACHRARRQLEKAYQKEGD